jgi:CelD/BcsL family acetyltransferase involved in cellulose biosynthesis
MIAGRIDYSSKASNILASDRGLLCVDVIPASELSGDLATHWEALRSRCKDFVTPFFSSRFTKVVGALRPDAKIAVLRRNQKIVGFLPFEYSGRNTIAPIGKAFNDVHGLLCDSRDPIDYCDVLQLLKVKSYRFHALAGPGVGAAEFAFGTTPSFLADLESHPEGYVHYLEKNRDTIFKQRRKTAKMIRDLGPLRLEIDSRSEMALEKMIQLKRDQYQRTFIFDLLSVPWSRQMLRTLWESDSENCRGLLSVLYAGDKLVAAHYGMLEGKILHYWFPVYDPAYHQYSPGTAIFLEIARQADTLGIKKIDLGYGAQPYKYKFVDTITEMPFGCVSNCKLTLLRERAKVLWTAGIKRVPGKPLLKKIVRSLWPQLGQDSYQ